MMCSSSLPQESHGFCIGTLLQTYAEMIIIAVVIPIAIVIAVSVAVASAIRELKMETFSGRRRPDWQRKPGTKAAVAPRQK